MPVSPDSSVSNITSLSSTTSTICSRAAVGAGNSDGLQVMGALWRRPQQAEGAEGDWSCKREGSSAAESRLCRGAWRRTGKWGELLGTQSISLASISATTTNPECDLAEQPQLRFPGYGSATSHGLGQFRPQLSPCSSPCA